MSQFSGPQGDPYPLAKRKNKGVMARRRQEKQFEAVARQAANIECGYSVVRHHKNGTRVTKIPAPLELFVKAGTKISPQSVDLSNMGWDGEEVHIGEVR